MDMKLNKIQQRELLNTIRETAKKNSYKIRGDSIFSHKGEIFNHCDFLVVGSSKIVYRIYTKYYSYDDIFWNIMHMPKNGKSSDSLRACGAFKAPSILIGKGERELSDDYEEVSNFLVREIDDNSRNFLLNNEIDEYVINCEKGVDKDILKCLAYIHMGCRESAIDNEKSALKNGNKGRFDNSGKSFFEWLLSKE